jgi:hypothetical protein
MAAFLERHNDARNAALRLQSNGGHDLVERWSEAGLLDAPVKERQTL